MNEIISFSLFSIGTKNVAKGLSKITQDKGIDNMKAELLDISMYSNSTYHMHNKIQTTCATQYVHNHTI